MHYFFNRLIPHEDKLALKNRRRRSHRLESLEDRSVLSADISGINISQISPLPPGHVVAGETITYLIAVPNAASATTATTHVNVSDTLPAGETVVNASASQTAGGTTVSIDRTSGQVTADLGTIAVGAEAFLTITALVNPTASSPLTDTATVWSPEDVTFHSSTNVKTSNSVSTIVDPTPATAANVSISGSAASTIASGDLLTYTFTLTNHGGAAATNVAFMDQLDANEAFFSASDSAGTNFNYDSATGGVTGTVGSIAASQSDTVTLTVVSKTGHAGATLTDNAFVAVAGGNAATTTSANEQTTVTAAVPTAATVSLAKSGPATIAAGAAVTDTITLANTGSSAVTNVAVVDSLGANVSGVTATDSAGDKFTFSGGLLTGTVANLTAGGSTQIAVVFTPSVVGNLADSAAVGVAGGNQASATADFTTTVQGVGVTQSLAPVVNVGQLATDLLTVTNTTSTAAANVAVSASLGTSPGLSFVSAVDLNGNAFSFDPATGKLTGTIGNLAANASDTILLSFVPTASGTLNVAASVTSNGTTMSSNASANVSASATAGNVSVSKNVPANATVGDRLTETITLTNAGASATTAGNAMLYDVLGPNQAFVSATDTLGDTFAFDPVTRAITGKIASIPTGNSNSDTITITLLPTAAGTISDTAGVAVSGGNQATSLTATGSTNVAAAGSSAANVSISESAPSSAVVGDIVTQTITLANAGSSAAANVAFIEQLSTSTAILSVSDTAGTNFNFNSLTGLIAGSIASIGTGSSNTDTITIKYIPVVSGTVKDSAAIAILGGNQGTANVTASTTVSSAPNTAANVTVAKSVPATATVGSLVTATVTVTNAGGAAAANVAFVDELPAGEAFVSASDAAGDKFSYANGQVTGTISSVAASGTATINIVTIENAAGSVTDGAVVGISGGNQASPLAQGTVSVSGAGSGAANVSVAKSVPATAALGAAVTDTITLTNNGSSAVTNVSFVDSLGANVSNVSATDAAGDKFTFDGNQVVGTIADLATGATTITLVFTPTVAGAFTDTASIGISGGNQGNSVATATTTVSAAVQASQHVYVINSTGTSTISAAQGLLVGTAAGDTVVAGTVTGNTGGTFVFNADGSFTYTPPASFAGFDYANFTLKTSTGATSSATVWVLSQHAGVVWKFYEVVLGRQPDVQGLGYWTNYFNNGGSTGDMAVGFFESTELLDRIITGYYQQYLLRTPDSEGLSYWVGIWQSTGEPEVIKAGFADSPEFYASAGGTPSGWITALYNRILDRAPDPQGDQFWLNFYQQATAAGTPAGLVRYEIALGFFDSPESYGDDVNAWFQEYLFRGPTPAEAGVYINQMLAGATDRTIEQEITSLPEYANNPPAPPAGVGVPLPNYQSSLSASAAARDAVFNQLGS